MASPPLKRPAAPPANAPTAKPGKPATEPSMEPIAAPLAAELRVEENNVPAFEPKALATFALAAFCMRLLNILAIPLFARPLRRVLAPDIPPVAVFSVLLNAFPVFSICFSTLDASFATRDRFRRASSKVSCFPSKMVLAIASPVSENCFSAARSSCRALSVLTFRVDLVLLSSFSFFCIPSRSLVKCMLESRMVFMAAEK